GIEESKLKVIPAEIGGGLGGKTVIYLEPLAVMLAKKAGRPVKMTMTRDEVLRATGPTSGGIARAKVGAKTDGTLVSGELELHYEAGAYAGSPVALGCMTGFAPYNLENVSCVGWDVVVNRPKAAAYRAPGAPVAAFALDSVLDGLPQQPGMDPLARRLTNAAR